VKNVVDGGNGATASTSHAIDYYLVKPFLWLETGRQDSKAVYVGGDGTNVLCFEYEVTSGDLTYDLGYVDAHSLEPGLNAAAEPGVVYQVANSTPTVVALLSLPRSGHKGSLSFNADLRVDGTSRRQLVWG